MFNLTFSGSVSQKLFNNVGINTSRSSPPIGPTVGSTVPVDPYRQIIQWSNNVPGYLEGLTINGINSPTSGITGNVTTNATFTITSGLQFSANTGNPNINVTLYGPNKTVQQRFDMPTINDIGGSDPATFIPYCSSTKCPVDTVSLSSVPLMEVQAVPWNKCRLVACSNHDFIATMCIFCLYNCSNRKSV
jgi:hypothetical protein